MNISRFAKSFAATSTAPRSHAKVDPWVETESAPWSPHCTAFLEHWQSLRAPGATMPTTEAFLDSPSVDFAPHVFILDLLDAVPIVRLQGTGLAQEWGRDLTGENFFPGRSDRFIAGAMVNMRKVVGYPCGHLARTSYSTSKGREVTSDWIQLPLAVKPWRPPRIVGAAFHASKRDMAETLITFFKRHKLAWLDAGCGVPADVPAELED